MRTLITRTMGAYAGLGNTRNPSRREGPAPQTSWSERLFARFADRSSQSRRRVIDWRWVVVPGFLPAVFIAIVLARRLDGEFLSLIDDGRVTIKVKMPTGPSVQETGQVLRAIEAWLAGDH